jgi:putative flavoprotein involved in K+ transport
MPTGPADPPGVTGDRHATVVVVGGGQAGLAAGYYLAQAGVDFVILDAEERVGDVWRRRWDSLNLFSVAGYSALPGLAFPGDPERFPGKDEVADYVETYAETFDLPVQPRTTVTSLASADGGYRLDTNSGGYGADQVIVATGAYQRPRVPAFAGRLGQDVAQIHASEYRRPQQVATGDVLVVGAANSGAQIAEDLAPSHQTYLSRGAKIPHMPLRILGKGLHWWGDHLGLIAAPLDSWRGRTQRGDMLIGTSLRQLAHRGVNLVGRAVGADGRTVHFADGRTLEPATIVWATGFRSDYSWIHLPVLDAAGLPIHRRGVTESPGLYFLGMHNQYSRGSSLLGFVRHDAEFIVDQTDTSQSLKKRAPTSPTP